MTLLTLGIETSCDETAAAVYSSKKGLLSSVLFSQIMLHKEFGGVVPEIASRSQLEKIAPIIEEALQQAKVTLNDIDVVAVTSKPGLPGSLLVGVCFAKSIALARKKKIIGINHLEGHAFSSFIEHTPPFPHLCITASGGHTSLYRITGYGDYEVLGQTVDDAAGEAFDKISKILGLGYPGGPIIEAYAAKADFKDYFHYPRASAHSYNFSFSGLKTAVLYDMVKRGGYDMATKTFLKKDDEEFKSQVASSLLVCVADMFIEKLNRAYKDHRDIEAITFVGGVACNKYIRNRLQAWCDNHNLALFIPSPRYCTDNGAMIALVGSYKAQQGKFSSLELDILS